MQEEVEQRIVSLMISCGKLGEQEFRKAVAKLLEQLKNDRQKHQYSKANPHGKMTVKQLAAKDKGLQSIEVTDQNIGSFNRIARKYGMTARSMSLPSPSVKRIGTDGIHPTTGHGQTPCPSPPIPTHGVLTATAIWPSTAIPVWSICFSARPAKPTRRSGRKPLSGIS